MVFPIKDRIDRAFPEDFPCNRSKRKILNVPATLPLYFTATALAKLAHQAASMGFDGFFGVSKVCVFFQWSVAH